jgi:pimeloyl-ACP methyl ester carboxylesterase
MSRVYEGLNLESDFQGQFPWRSHRIDVGGGIRQAVVDEGPRAAPVTFVLLHGNPTWGFLYRKFVTVLAEEYRVVVPDHVGFGRSDKPLDPAYYTLERHIANLTLTLERLNVNRAVLVMQDWGGPIGMGWATRHVDRVGGFVVMNTWAFVERPPLKLPWLFKLLVLGKGGWKRATQRNLFTEMFLIRGSRLDTATADAYRAPHPTPAERIGIARFPQLIPETANPAHESRRTMATIESALPSIADRPALLMWAQKDRAFNALQLERWRTLFGNLDGPHLLPAAGHFLQEDAPDEIVPRLRAWADAHFRGAQTPL